MTTAVQPFRSAGTAVSRHSPEAGLHPQRTARFRGDPTAGGHPSDGRAAARRDASGRSDAIQLAAALLAVAPFVGAQLLSGKLLRLGFNRLQPTALSAGHRQQ